MTPTTLDRRLRQCVTEKDACLALMQSNAEDYKARDAARDLLVQKLQSDRDMLFTRVRELEASLAASERMCAFYPQKLEEYMVVSEQIFAEKMHQLMDRHDREQEQAVARERARTEALRQRMRQLALRVGTADPAVARQQRTFGR